MSEYIEREAAVTICDKQYKECLRKSDFCGDTVAWNICADIKAIPAADVAPVVHGRWIHSRYEDCCDQFELVKCSQCNHEAYAIAFYVRDGNYCPNCGAKMDKENGGDRHTEPKANARGHSGDAVCVEPDDFCSYGEPKEGTNADDHD